VRRPEFIARQGRRPTGILGHIVGRVMAAETAPDDETTLELLDVQPSDRVLELGYGHGRTIGKVAGLLKDGHALGVDFSTVMHAIARHRNRQHIRGGRLELRVGDSRHLPFSDRSFDKVYALHTLYFWSDAAGQIVEVARILEPGGLFVLGFRPGENEDFAQSFPSSIYRIRTRGEVERLLCANGFAELRAVNRNPHGGLTTWIVGRKA